MSATPPVQLPWWVDSYDARRDAHQLSAHMHRLGTYLRVAAAIHAGAVTAVNDARKARDAEGKRHAGERAEVARDVARSVRVIARAEVKFHLRKTHWPPLDPTAPLQRRRTVLPPPALRQYIGRPWFDPIIEGRAYQGPTIASASRVDPTTFRFVSGDGSVAAAPNVYGVTGWPGDERLEGLRPFDADNGAASRDAALAEATAVLVPALYQRNEFGRLAAEFQFPMSSTDDSIQDFMLGSMGLKTRRPKVGEQGALGHLFVEEQPWALPAVPILGKVSQVPGDVFSLRRSVAREGQIFCDLVAFDTAIQVGEALATGVPGAVAGMAPGLRRAANRTGWSVVAAVREMCETSPVRAGRINDPAVTREVLERTLEIADRFGIGNDVRLVLDTAAARTTPEATRRAKESRTIHRTPKASGPSAPSGGQLD